MSLNDPQWGKRGGGSGGGGGPPDLDEIWRNVNRRMSELFGRKTGGDQPAETGGGAPGRGLPVGGVAILVALVVAVWLASGFYIVDEGRRGVVTRFGKYIETTQPGPRWHLPFPIEAAELVDFSQVKTIEIGYRNTPKNKVDKEAVMLTDDENIIDIAFAVQYNLKSAEDYTFNNRRPDQLVAFVAESAIREVVGKQQDGLRALRGPRADRQADRAADAADARPLPRRASSCRRSRCRASSRPTRCRPRSTTRSRRARIASG